MSLCVAIPMRGGGGLQGASPAAGPHLASLVLQSCVLVAAARRGGGGEGSHQLGSGVGQRPCGVTRAGCTRVPGTWGPHVQPYARAVLLLGGARVRATQLTCVCVCVCAGWRPGAGGASTGGGACARGC